MNYEKLCRFIYSRGEYSKTHNQFVFLGLKLRYPKKNYIQIKKANPFWYYKKSKTDITTVPKAEGKLRDLQLANLAILKQFDDFCRRRGLEYFLFAGSALGQIRHKGFIPWDDDIDVAMPRGDYEKVLQEFNRSNNDLLYAELYSNDRKSSFIIKIRSKKSDKFFIDIFALDFTGRRYSREEQLTQTKEIKKLRRNLINSNKSDIYDELLNIRDRYVTAGMPEDTGDILLGTEWGHSESNWFLRYDTVYPLKDVVFEEMKFKSMANPIRYLEEYYGNYMDYPRKLPKGHSMYDDFNAADLRMMEELKGLL